MAEMQFQTSLLPELVEDQRIDKQEDWINDDWETPDNLAQFIGSLIQPSDRFIVDAGAGKGAISKHLPLSRSRSAPSQSLRKITCNHQTVCAEINQERFNIGKRRCPGALWIHCDFLDPSKFDLLALNGAHVIVANPPFSLLLEFIDQGIKLLEPGYPIARLLYVAPCDALQSKKRNKIFNLINCHVHHTYAIVGRVAYIKNGKALCGRQINDVVLDIRPGKLASSITFFEV